MSPGTPSKTRHLDGVRLGSRVSIIVTFAVVLSGCSSAANRPVNPTSGLDPGDRPQMGRSSVGAASSIFDRPLTRLVVEFKVLRISAPRGAFTGDSEIWKRVPGPLPTAAMTQQLADNGFRAAIGRESDRKPLLDALDVMRARVDLRAVPDQAVPDANKLIELELGACDPRLALFFHDPQGRLRGMDFESAKAKLLVSFEMRTSNLHEVTLKVIPALEEPPGPPRWVMSAEGSAQQVPEERRHVFQEVVLTAQIPEGGFLLLGAGDIVYDLPYLGRPFFLEREAKDSGDGPSWRESIYIISPVIRSLTEHKDSRSGS